MSHIGWPLLQAVIGLLILSLLVFVHEFGHFIVARAVGIRVLVFSIGFGRKLWRKIASGTEYAISALPFGGYVKLAGQDPDEDIDHGSGDYRHKKIWQRAAVVFAGPFANYVLAVFALWILFMAGVRERPLSDDMIVGGLSDSSAAEAADIRIGDKILNLDGSPVEDWEDFYTTVAMRGGKPVRITIQRDQQVLEKTVVLRKINIEGIGAFGDAGIFSREQPVVGEVLDSSAADLAGLAAGDTVLRINGKRMYSWPQMVSIVGAMQQEGRFTVKRHDSVLTLFVVPRYNAQEKRYMIGISRAIPQLVWKRYGPLAALSRAFEKANGMIETIYTVVKGLVAKTVSPKAMAGPLGIVQMTGTAARTGLDTLVLFMAMLSVNLAIINLLPLAITDGGVLLFLLLEKIRGRPFGRRTQAVVQQVALFLFIALFLFVTFNDLQRSFHF